MRKRWRWLIILGIVLTSAALVVPFARAWYHFVQARQALATYRTASARQHLDVCLQRWPDDLEIRLLASRAARQMGDLEVADQHLRQAKRIAPDSQAVAFEWALLQATAGNLGEVETYLQRRAERAPELGPLVWEALAEGYIRMYRILDAIHCLDHWLERDRECVRALSQRGLAYRLGRSSVRAADDLRQVIALDPTRADDRWQLALALLDIGAYDEAYKHLTTLEPGRPGDAEVQVRLARCENMLGQAERASSRLDAILNLDPRHVGALRLRGQMALMDRKPAEAERWLHQAVQINPEDYQTNWILFQALQQQKKDVEAKKQLAVAERIKDRLERLGELRSRKMSEQPLDPALHCEMALLLLRGGQPEQAERWLHSALGLDSSYRPAHRALAELYQKNGDKARAEQHRQAAQP